MFEGALQTKSKLTDPWTDIGNDAFPYTLHLLTWLLSYEWTNASILEGVSKFDAPVQRIPWMQGQNVN